MSPIYPRCLPTLSRPPDQGRRRGAELSVSRSRFYSIYSSYLRASASARSTVGRRRSGGNHRQPWPQPPPLDHALAQAKPPCSYSLAASEVMRASIQPGPGHRPRFA